MGHRPGTAEGHAMNRLALALIAAAAAALVAAVGSLVVTGGLGPLRVTPAEAHLNLLGWASLAAVWLTYARLPALAENRRAAAAQAALSFLAAFGFPAGIAVAHDTGDQRLLVAASVVWLGSAVLFLARLATSARGEAARA
jgi:hypothetical protein